MAGDTGKGFWRRKLRSDMTELLNHVCREKAQMDRFSSQFAMGRPS